MRLLFLSKIILFIVTAGVFITGCNNVAMQEQGNEETQWQFPDELSVAPTNKTLYIHLAVNDPYGSETASACMLSLATRTYDDFQERLLHLYNIKLDLTYFPSEQGLIQGIREGTFDGLICKPWLAFASETYGEAAYKRIADVLDPFDNQWLAGIFVVKKEAPIHEFKDIEGKVLALGAASTFEKHHAALSLLKEKGISIGETIITSRCLDGLGLLKEEKAEVALISDYVMVARSVTLSAEDKIFRIIGQTEDIPLTSVILDHKKINHEDAYRFREALLELSGDKTPAGFSSAGFVKAVSWQPVSVSEHSAGK